MTRPRRHWPPGRGVWRWMLPALPALLLATGAAAQTRDYHVQPGDSCWSIAEKVFGDGEAYKIIHKYNNLGPLPHVLEPGQVIRLPGKSPEPDAQVNWTRKLVQTKPPRTPDWRRAAPGMPLWRLYKVSTGTESSAGIVFADQSHLRMRENALLLIHGRSAGASRIDKTEVTLEKGTLRGGLAKLDADRSVAVRTPSANVGLQAAEAQVEVTEARTAVVSVYEGKADVSAQGRSVEVPSDYGTVVELRKIPMPPKPLPPPPRWDEEGTIVALAPPGSRGRFRVSWQKVARARRYRIEVARDADFRRVIHDVVFPALTTEAEVRDLDPGVWFTRVAAIDRDRLEGRPNPAREVRVIRPTGSRLLIPDGEVLETTGLVALDFPGTDSLEVAVDGAAFGPRTRPLLLTPGEHTVAVRQAGSQATSQLRVRVLAVRAELNVAGQPEVGLSSALRVRPGAVVPISLSLRDERGRPASIPGLSVRLLGGREIPMRMLEPGELAGRLATTSGEADRALDLVVSWPGGELARTTIYVEPVAGEAALVDRRTQTTFTWPVRPPQIGGATELPGGPAQPITDTTSVGLTAGAADQDDATLLRLALRGSLALGRWVAFFDFPWLVTDPTVDPAIASDLGDLRIGALVRVWERGGFALAPTLRLSIPTATPAAGQRRQMGFEPGLMVQWDNGRTDRHRVVLATNQLLVARTDFANDTTWTWTAQLTAAWRPVRWFELAAEVDGIFAIDGGERGHAALAGGSLAFIAGPARFGLYGRGGLTDATRQRFGAWTAGISVDLGWDLP